MSEVSIRAAYGAYRKHAESEELDELYRSIVRGQLEYGYTITQIYSFIDVLGDVQLFYVRKTEGLGDLKTSPYVKNLALVWEQPNEVHPAPDYLKRAFAEVKSE